MILGYENEEIVKLAVENQSYHFDGVVQYNWKENKLFGCSMSQNEQENPLNPFIEVFRLKQGEQGIIEYNCKECYVYDDDMHQECCAEFYASEFFEDDFSDNFEDELRKQIREVLWNNFEDLDICESIYLKISEICDSVVVYQQKIFNNNYKQNCIDTLEDTCYEYGFPSNINKDCLTSEIDALALDLEQSIDSVYMYNDEKKINFIQENKLNKALDLLKEEKLSECLEILNNSECYCDEWGLGL